MWRPAALSGIFAKLSAVTGRCFFVCGALLVFANVAFGDGTYQRTKNGRTLVWNNHPKPGDEATWWGGRDRDGYARGFGTLTWYAVLGKSSSAKPVLYARYWGNMVRGKLNGRVNVHSRRKTDHAIFADGVRTTPWAGGPAPSRSELATGRVRPIGGPDGRSEPDWRVAARAAASAAGQQARFNNVPGPSSAKRSDVASPEAPAEGPSRTGSPSRTGTTVAKTETGQLSELNAPPEIQDNAEFSTTVERGRLSDSQPPTIPDDIDNSLRLLVWPPRHLRKRPVSTGSLAGPNPEAALPAANARLTKKEVVDLADAVARSRGYDLAEYQRPEPQYDPADQTWSLLYEQKPVDGTAEIGKHFSVAVRDKTKGTALVPGK
jgi:hypothetical protein